MKNRRRNPLKRGRSRAVISSNISKLRREGYPEKQAVAISLRNAGVARKRRRNPSGGSLLKNPLVWIAGGGIVAVLAYRYWAGTTAGGAAGTTAGGAANLTPKQQALYNQLVASGLPAAGALNAARVIPG